MHGLIVSLLMETNWTSFFMVVDALLEENEDYLEKASYLEKTK
jgi:hypothetical protein